MEEFKGTSGTWKKFKYGFLIEDSANRTIASVCASVSKIPNKEAEANAKLIAAAPDLLQACIDVCNINNMDKLLKSKKECKKAIQKALK